jgi:hypothetical protein
MEVRMDRRDLADRAGKLQDQILRLWDDMLHAYDSGVFGKSDWAKFNSSLAKASSVIGQLAHDFAPDPPPTNVIDLAARRPMAQQGPDEGPQTAA